MWLTLLWQNKGLVALVALLAAFAGLATAVKVQSARLATAKEEIQTTQTQRDVAIAAHDRLVDDWKRQQAALNEREALRKQQEAENAKLHRTIQDILKSHRAWADARLPVAIVGVLQALPANAPAASPGPSTGGAASPGFHGLDQRGSADVGGIHP